MKLSRPFLCMLAGLAMTAIGWFVPFAWFAAEPGLLALRAFRDFADYSFNAKAAVMLLLIVLNSGTWAIVAYIAIALIARRRRV